MKHKLEIFYSVENYGDGSAYPRWMESLELADFDQYHMDEGWGENCSGSIKLESDSPIICTDNIITKEMYLYEKYLSNVSAENIEKSSIFNEMIEFIEEFFPDGIDFKVKIEKGEFAYNGKQFGRKDGDYHKYNLYFNDRLIHTFTKLSDYNIDERVQELTELLHQIKMILNDN